MRRLALWPLLGLLAATDITFFAMGDPQYGGGRDDKNDWQIAAMNAFPGALWPAALADGRQTGFKWVGEEVPEPLGVIIAGDITQNGQDGRWRLFGEADELGAFLLDYGLDGTDGRLRWPVYEGLGNHDFDSLEDWWWGGAQPVLSALLARNRRRALPGGLAAPAGHYRWAWDGVHFVQANLFAGAGKGAGQGVRDPHGGLAFVEEALAEAAGRPVVLVQHYGFDPFSSQDRWWNEEQRDALAEVLEGHNVVAIIHGHVHGTGAWAHYTWEGFDVYKVGTPYGDRGRFTVFRITDGWLQAGDVAWERDDPASPTMEWLAWAHSKPIDMGVGAGEAEPRP